MEIYKTIQPEEQEVKICLDSNDIYLILTESKESLPAILRSLNTIACFLKGVPAERIAELTITQKDRIREFLYNQALRYL